MNSPGADRYLCMFKEKVRTMFRIGFVESDQPMYNIKLNIFNDCLWHPIAIIVDSTGAGDSFRAGLIDSLIYINQALNNSLHFTSASVGLNYLSYGGNSRTPTSQRNI
ncbi:hypothetical protein DICPUDRAFT_85644 [Dictyostelium purpureum]|uniref:Uncharacterized protein n=1 Tax=Dictyostelium purpureum TaxID=5786 RepID=F1A6E3_DICPU|nr:uncharacterized protein DICPUDRAFT_85644 [Dictyostelium purpureum]EGC28237.1 hypothetical protein DICPUDRAFT_85644 [Dictyostelium purpureum]|eukprot:XP_003295237.1 hypothetical protein DICPUDRAFT_85644 [Dictyostelium purpureum]